MLIIVDKKMPAPAKENLAAIGELMELETNDITYAAISGHADIFFCQTPHDLIAAPSLPEKYFEKLEKNKIRYVTGKQEVGKVYPKSAVYNVVVTNEFLIHNSQLTDPVVSRVCRTQKTIKVKQGYCRCNLLALPENRFITSDRGIEKVLQKQNIITCFTNPAGILLPGFPNGFFGGCCGIAGNTAFICGNLQQYPEGEKVREFIYSSGLKIKELYQGPLVDIGGIFFIEASAYLR